MMTDSVEFFNELKTLIVKELVIWLQFLQNLNKRFYSIVYVLWSYYELCPIRELFINNKTLIRRSIKSETGDQIILVIIVPFVIPVVT